VSHRIADDGICRFLILSNLRPRIGKMHVRFLVNVGFPLRDFAKTVFAEDPQDT
jgi:hypothetical protein